MTHASARSHSLRQVVGGVIAPCHSAALFRGPVTKPTVASDFLRPPDAHDQLAARWSLRQRTCIRGGPECPWRPLFGTNELLPIRPIAGHGTDRRLRRIRPLQPTKAKIPSPLSTMVEGSGTPAKSITMGR